MSCRRTQVCSPGGRQGPAGREGGREGGRESKEGIEGEREGGSEEGRGREGGSEEKRCVSAKC